MTDNNTPPPQKATGLTRIIRAFGYSRDGLKAAFSNEAAFRQECAAAAVMIPLAFFIAPDRVMLALMVASVLLVMIVELLNSAVEAAIDRFGPERHPLAKYAKDAGSAAVLVALILAGLVWLIALT
ncbi:MAG TPA: diacylglycerol kinase [Alphaproteobacteria bacterium]|nr:diacylglycerol kinase [Rhodospirillaceae bacterium]HRJ66331.1 diacylglycerol kinase [Alphaproteobacteria bacterium]